MARKSSLRRGSFLGRKSTTFSFEKDDDSSIQRIVPPCCKAKVAPVAPVAPVKKTKSKEENPAEEEEDPIPVVVDTNKETRTEDFEDERSLLPGDDKIDMSVTIDSTVDEVSRIPTFDYQVDDEKTIEKSLEITYENYVEFEKRRKQRPQKVAESDVSEEATCGESLGGVEGDDLQGEKFVDEVPPILSTSDLVSKLQETEINRIKELKEMNQAEIEKMKSQVQQIKTAMIKRKCERVPIKKTVEKRMKESLELVERALAAQKKIENEFSLYKVKSTQWQTRFVVPPLEKSPSQNLTAPPPVQFGMKLRADYEATDDASILVEDDDEKSYKSVKVMSRAKGLKLKPQPSRNSVVRAWNELVEMAEDLRYLCTEGLAEVEEEDDENDSVSSEKSSGRMGFFKNCISQRQVSKAEEAGAEKK